ncbi:MAG: hypothetical protein H7138_24215 [Myxococcales bacterium]|nr:hypothetical protein [Myxococcales bacterium]
MNTIALTRRVLAVAWILVGAHVAHAQPAQAFEEKYVTGRAAPGELVALPTVGIVPVDTVPLDADVATQLTEAMQKHLAAVQDNRFEVITRATGTKVSWAFVVRNAPRAMHDAFTVKFTDQLVQCLHSLASDVEIASLNLLLVGGTLSDAEERAEANAAGAKMLVHWKADRCVTRRNDLPFIDSNRARLTVATRGMLTDVFDPLVFQGQGLLDLITALSPVYFQPGGFWTTELSPRLRTLFDGAVDAGLLDAVEGARIVDRDLRTFWDWAILVIASHLGVVRSFVEITATGCVKTAPELSTAFNLSRCIASGRLTLVPLRVAGQDYVAVHRVTP